MVRRIALFPAAYIVAQVIAGPVLHGNLWPYGPLFRLAGFFILFRNRQGNNGATNLREVHEARVARRLPIQPPPLPDVDRSKSHGWSKRDVWIRRVDDWRGVLGWTQTGLFVGYIILVAGLLATELASRHTIGRVTPLVVAAFFAVLCARGLLTVVHRHINGERW